jgi:hypothetical protein
MTPEQDITTTQNRLCTAALNAEAAGQLRDAAVTYREAIQLDTANATPYLFYGFALDRLGEHEAALQVWSLGADLDSNFINAWRSDRVDELVRLRSKAANDALRRHFTAQHARCVDEYLDANPGADIDRIADAIWCQTHEVPFEYRHPEQQPHLFYVPGLESIPVYSREQAPWFRLLEDGFEEIRSEFLAAQEAAAGEQAPYLAAGVASLGDAWKPIAGSLNWGSFHLYKQGQPNAKLIGMFPRTLEVLEQVPLVQTPTGPSEVLFSVLQGKQLIPPHFGVANTDMTVHLPIVYPGDAAIKVVDEVYEWQPGKVFAFDDAFRHESWNRSAAPRVNLLFEAWHPHLGEHERAAVMAAFQARLRWNAGRSLDHASL